MKLVRKHICEMLPKPMDSCRNTKCVVDFADINGNHAGLHTRRQDCENDEYFREKPCAKHEQASVSATMDDHKIITEVMNKARLLI
ncbi:hypothetical protein M514_22851 [Trichuris suis]|uniref:Uncharacterized protein n=1 Tax=Trichuris suis TaxID=68888 RepID=A0A085N6A6_9BILA|nr:hypothetical protein M514_22851 [Trichuris suis]